MDQASRRVSRANREASLAANKARHFQQGFKDWQAFMLGQLDPKSVDYLHVKSIKAYTQMTPMEQLVAARNLQLHPKYSNDRHNDEYLRQYIQDLANAAK